MISVDTEIINPCLYNMLCTGRFPFRIMVIYNVRLLFSFQSVYYYDVIVFVSPTPLFYH